MRLIVAGNRACCNQKVFVSVPIEGAHEPASRREKHELYSAFATRRAHGGERDADLEAGDVSEHPRRLLTPAPLAPIAAPKGRSPARGGAGLLGSLGEQVTGRDAHH